MSFMAYARSLSDGGIDFDRIREDNPLSAVAGAVVKLKSARGEWKGCCPFHNERSASFTIFDGDRRFHCFGCGASGDVFDFVSELHGVEIGEAARMLSGGEVVLRSGPYNRSSRRTDDRADARDTVGEARDIWQHATPAGGTDVEAYLAGRGLRLPIGDTLRFARLQYGTRGSLHPVMIALVVAADGTPTGIQRTYLAAGGRGKADVPKAKLSLGRVGGGAIRLGVAAAEVVVCEGIEDALTLQQELGTPAWAVAGATNLPAMVLGVSIRSVIVGRDNDEAGEREARKAAEAFTAQGASVRIISPSSGFKDFNAQLQEGL